MKIVINLLEIDSQDEMYFFSFFLFYNEFKLYELYLRIIRKIKIIIYTGISLTRTMLKAAWNIDIDRLVQARAKESPGMSNGPVE